MPVGPVRSSRRPILVSGMPRSGTTWLGRLFAAAEGAALIGREPMNPHEGQYRLGGTVDRWTELRDPTPRQARALRRAYRGLSPMTYGRYGQRQWAAPLPWTRVVVKDPFAMLSLPCVEHITGARPVLLYRHPGAALVSYRRMGWQPDLDELRPLLDAHRARCGTSSGAVPLPERDTGSDASAMAAFWSALYEMALDNAERSGEDDLVIVSHEELAGGGIGTARALFAHLGLRWSASAAAEFGKEPTTSKDAGVATGHRLHEFDRAPSAVAGAWRASLDSADIDRMESVSAPVAGRLEEARWRPSA